MKKRKAKVQPPEVEYDELGEIIDSAAVDRWWDQNGREFAELRKRPLFNESGLSADYVKLLNGHTDALRDKLTAAFNAWRFLDPAQRKVIEKWCRAGALDAVELNRIVGDYRADLAKCYARTERGTK